MKISHFFREYKDWIVVLLAIVLPMFVILLYPNYFHRDDMREFLNWSKAWDSNWRRIYLECTGCTYPFLGTFFSGGVVSFIDFEKIRYIVRAFHLCLALIDAINIVIVFFILRELDIYNPLFWAGVIGLLPSSWIGTSYWGQIDGFGQFFILAIILFNIVFNKKAELNANGYQIYLIGSGILLACLLLTKQLVLFSLLCLVAMILTNIFLHSRGLRNVLVSVSVFFISLAAPVILIDLMLEMPAPYVSHLPYILQIGSRIGDVIASFGFNMWIFFYDDTLVSSHTLLINIDRFTKFEISPFSVGVLLFLMSNMFFLIFLLRYFYKLYKSNTRFFRKPDILLWLLYLSFVNLSFNIFLTGTHERYLYHFYPFIIISFLGNSFVKRRGLYILLAGAIFYGAFLFGYLSGLIILSEKFPFYAMAIFHFLLLVYLIISANKYFFIHNTLVVGDVLKTWNL